MGVPLDLLRQRAERCLASPAPTKAVAHELAVEVLASLARLEESFEAHPYRAGVASAAIAPSVEGFVAIERALADANERLRVASARIAELEAEREAWRRGTPPR